MEFSENPIKRTFIVKKATKDTTKNRRFCLNCGKDISNMHERAKYCCQECGMAYREMHNDVYAKQSKNDLDYIRTVTRRY